MVTEKRRQYNREYYKKNKNKVDQKIKEWREKNPERSKKLISTAVKKYNLKHPEKVKETQRKYRENNSEKVKLGEKNWRKKNPDYMKTPKQLENKRRGAIVERLRHPKRVLARRLAQFIKIPKNQLCECNCGRKAEERHHEDYNKPLKVKFVCVKCHNKIHRRKKL